MKTKLQPCSKCRIPLKPYYLKNGVCNGCRNPHLIVVAIVSKGGCK